MKNKNGFTLMELMAVLAILGVIVSMTIINVQSVSTKRKKEDYDNLVKLIEKNTKLLISQDKNYYIKVNSKITYDKNLNKYTSCKIMYNELVENSLIDINQLNPKSGSKINEDSYVLVSVDNDYNLKYEFIDMDEAENLTKNKDVTECMK